jgi:predicted nucleotidyltransferase
MTTSNVLQGDPLLSELVRRLREAFHPECIYLFGSRARGEAGPDSDYDLLVVISASSAPRYQRDQTAYRVLSGAGVSKDVLVLTREEFERRRNVPSSLPATVEREDLLVYAA